MRATVIGLAALTIVSASCIPWSEPVNYNPFKCTYAVEPKGARELGMDVRDSIPTSDRAANVQTLKALGGSFQTLTLSWSDLEGTGSGVTSGPFTDPNGVLAAMETVASQQGVKLALTIRPVDLTTRTVPSDLDVVRFGAGRVRTRFKALADWIFTKISPAHLTAFMIGRELDRFDPVADNAFWSEFATFLGDVATYLHATYPGLKIGFSGTLKGLTDTAKTLRWGESSVQTMQTYAGLVDVIGVTYYPLDASSYVQTPVPAADLANLTAKYANEIHVVEAGFPSSMATGSSGDLQSNFVCEVLHAWDAYGARIPSLAFTRLNDLSRNEAESRATAAGIRSEPYIEMLRSLGLRSYEGTTKNAYRIFEEELGDRGFH